MTNNEPLLNSQPAGHTARANETPDTIRQSQDYFLAQPPPQVFAEDTIDIGNGRRAHFRRDRRFAQVQVAFTAPKGIDPNPGREVTDQFKELGWAWKPGLAGKPWVYQLDRPTRDDPTARGDSHDVLHEQFLLIIQEYRVKRGMPPFLDPFSPQTAEPLTQVSARSGLSGGNLLAPSGGLVERHEPQSGKRETRAGGTPEEMLGDFASVGVECFDLTLTDIQGKKVAYRGNQSLDQLRIAMPRILDQAEQNERNVIIRPRGPVIQLDDLDETAVERLRPVSFLILRTSPGNHQAWVAVADANEDFVRRLRKGVGADPTASGATRATGSINFKEKYAPVFPRIETVEATPGRVLTRADLEALDILAPAENIAAKEVRRPQYSAKRCWPSFCRTSWMPCVPA